MTKWIYCVVYEYISDSKTEVRLRFLNHTNEIKKFEEIGVVIEALGNNGWELVTVTDVFNPETGIELNSYFFKRPREE